MNSAKKVKPLPSQELTSNGVRVFSPAKVNLYLEVLAKREDGYHEVETVLQAINLHDEVLLRNRKSGIKVTCRREGVPEGEENLAYRAAAIILKEANLKRGVEIEIKKKIPPAAGLGGGSSNAAATLIGLKELWNLKNLTEESLESLAKKLGMDVPFFIRGGRALGKNRGEILTHLKSWKPFWMTIVIPDIKVRTTHIYENLCLGLTEKRERNKITLSDFEKLSARDWSSVFYNRLEEVTEKEYPQVKRIKERLRALGGAALMSGSGPAVFAAFPQKEAAERAAATIKEEFASRAEAKEPSQGRKEVYVAKTFSSGVNVVYEKPKV
jgi:4-diphosphocytidyl-2-C-methyl-D-erythritol kinase